jgi:gliding motility-associated-like protein
MRYTRSIIILCLVLFFCGRASAQYWQWARSNTGAGVDGWPVATDPSGNVFVAGYSWGTLPASFGSISVPFSTSATGGAYQCIIAKYDASGNIVWADGTKNCDALLISIAADPYGNVFMFGYVNSPTLTIGSFTVTNTVFPEAQYFLAKYDAFGHVIWVRNAGNVQNTYVAVGGIALILGTGGVATDDQGNVYITANFHLPSITIGSFSLTNADPSGKTNDIFLAKYDPNGNVVWAKSAGGIAKDEAYGITVTHSGDVYIAGQFNSPSVNFGPSVISSSVTGANENAFIARFNSSGSPVWASASGGSGGEYAVGLATDAVDNVYLTGGLKDNSISFAGSAITNPVPGKASLYLAKFDPANNLDWYRTIFSPSSAAWGYSIAMSKCGIVWVSGAMIDSVNIDNHVLIAPGPHTKDADPIFIAGYNSYGTYYGSAALPSGSDDQNGIACDAKGNLYISSDYETSRLFTVANDSFPVVSDTTLDGTEYLYLAKYPYLQVNAESFQHSNQDACLGSGEMLNAPKGYSQYLWSDGSIGPTCKVGDTGVYWVQSFDSCAAGSVDSFILGRNCICGKTLFLPNSFTPNGDGMNDIFYPRSGIDIKEIKSFHVFNRWGELLFERDNILPNDASNAWDGSYNNDKPRPDVYVWVVEAMCESGELIQRKGSVTIIR